MTSEIDFATLTWITAIPTASMIAGMILVQFWTPTKKMTALLQHFGAGVVICAVACEVLPEILDPAYSDLLDYLGIIIGFTVGVVSMLLIARLIPDKAAIEERTQKREELTKSGRVIINEIVQDHAAAKEVKDPADSSDNRNSDEAQPLKDPLHSSESGCEYGARDNSSKKCSKDACKRVCWQVPWGIIVPVATDACMDGLLIGITFIAANVISGLVMSLALAIEMCFLGVSTSNQMAKNNLPRRVAFPICFSLPFLIMLAGYLGATILASVSGPVFVAVLSFGLAALLFLVSDELLVEAHKDEETDTWWVTIFFFVGFGLVSILQKAIECNLGVSSSSSLSSSSTPSSSSISSSLSSTSTE
ncbi:ZIP family zinc transporter [Pelomyxa schiedti]|nr:ZIP family zinc transporter [Pelomyxa schiedti]